jgi:hypothetical protein
VGEGGGGEGRQETQGPIDYKQGTMPEGWEFATMNKGPPFQVRVLSFPNIAHASSVLLKHIFVCS